MEKPKGPSGDLPIKVDLVKKPLLLNQGFILSCRMGHEGKFMYLGLGSGKIVLYDIVAKTFELLGKTTVGIYDLVVVSERKVATVDNNSIVRFFSKGKLVETLAIKTQYLTHANQIGKVLVQDKGHVYFISQSQTSFIKVNPKTYKTEEVPFEGGKVFQLTAVSNRVYGIREDGYVEIVYRKGDKLGIKPKPAHGKDSKGADKGKNPHDDSEEEEVPEEATDENGEVVYLRKSIKIEDITEDTDLDANNMSVIAGSEAEDDDEPDESSKTRLKSAQVPLYKEIEKPITNCFYRTISANDKYVVAVAHDGKGNNALYVYDAALNLLASKRVVIKKKDFSFNMNAYLHKIQLVMRGPRLGIFSISQKYEYKLFVFEYYQGEIKTVKKYRNVHNSSLSSPELITDLDMDGGALVSVSRDKKVNLYQIKFV